MLFITGYWLKKYSHCSCKKALCNQCVRVYNEDEELIGFYALWADMEERCKEWRYLQ